MIGKLNLINKGLRLSPMCCHHQISSLAQQLANELISRHRLNDHVVQDAGLSIASLHPDRNPDIQAEQWANQPFILGDLIAMDGRFACILASPLLWEYAAGLLECPLDECRFHFANITRKPAGIGPAINWHRDANNKYIATADRQMIRILVPLQDMSEVNGGTAVLPGSHLQKDSMDFSNAICPPVLAGSGLAIHSELLHGGSPNRSQQERDVIIVQFGLQASIFTYKAEEKLSFCNLKELTAFCNSI